MSNQPTARNLPEIWTAFANAQAQAYVDWLAQAQEAWLRCVLTRNPLECMSSASLMLPECVSSAMRYCKNVSDIAEACRELASAGAANAAAASEIAAPAGLVGSAGVAPAANHPASLRTPEVASRVPNRRKETSASRPTGTDDAK